jgi:lysyl-tRNA synthetase class 2
MKRKIIVENSSSINSIEYDIPKARLVVEFKAGSKYMYAAVPADVADDLFNAESKGKHFAAHIKDKFVTEKIGATLNKPVGHNVPLAWPFPTGYKP